MTLCTLPASNKHLKAGRSPSGEGGGEGVGTPNPLSPPGPGAPGITLTGDYGYAHPIGAYNVGDTVDLIDGVVQQMFKVSPDGETSIGPQDIMSYSWLGAGGNMPYGPIANRIPTALNTIAPGGPQPQWSATSNPFGPEVLQQPGQEAKNPPSGSSNNQPQSGSASNQPRTGQLSGKLLGQNTMPRDPSQELNKIVSQSRNGTIEATTYPDRTEYMAWDANGRYLGMLRVFHEPFLAQEPTESDEWVSRQILMERGGLSGKLAEADQDARETMDNALKSCEPFGTLTWPFDPTGTLHQAEVDAAKQSQWPQQSDPSSTAGNTGASPASSPGNGDDATTWPEQIPLIGGAVTDFRETLTALLLTGDVDRSMALQRQVRFMATNVLSDPNATDQDIKLAMQVLSRPFTADTLAIIGKLAMANAQFAIGVVAMARIAEAPLIAGEEIALESSTQVHHIVSNKGKWAKEFTELFQKHGVFFDLDGAINKMNLPGHVGRHINEYHQLVMDLLKEALQGKTGDDAAQAIVSVINELRQMLIDNPRLPYKDGGLR